MDDELITTAEAAKRLGVGPTSVKRWADAGVLPCVRTLGQHRRFLASAVEGFKRTLQAESAESTVGSDDAVDAWTRRLLELPDPHALDAAILAERARLGSWWAVCDFIGRVVAEVGARWARGEVTILEEHLASERLSRALARCTSTIPVRQSAPECLLATAEGDDHTLGLSLAEIVLREAGWSARFAGRRTPTQEILRVVEEQGVDMVAMSASSNSSNRASLEEQVVPLAEAAGRTNVLLVLGGTGAWPEPCAPSHRIRSFRDFHELLTRLGR